MRADQLPLLFTVGQPTVAPDGSFAVVSATRPSFEADAYTGQLWRIPLHGGAPTRITRGFRDTAPALSPDGRLLAFVRSDPGQPGQIWVAPATGGEAAQVTDAPLGASAPAWSPDSASLVYLARVPDHGRYGTLEGVPAPQEDPRHLTGYQIQANGLGWSTDRIAQLFVVATPDPYAEPPIAPVGRAAAAQEATSLLPASRQLTHGASDVESALFTPDGSGVVIVTQRGADLDVTVRSSLYRVDVATGEETPVLADGRISYVAATYSADGAHLYALGADMGEDGVHFVAANPSLYVADAEGRSPRRLTDPVEVELHHLAPAGAADVWTVRAQRGSSELWRVTPAGDVVSVWSGSPTVGLIAGIPGSDDALATVTSVDAPSELARVTGDGEPGQQFLTAFAEGLQAATSIATPTELTATSRDGYPVHGWVITPQGPGPHPVLLNIHGGPYADYTGDFFDEFQILSEAGYAVVYCNPRGSASYGQAHGAAITGNFGGLDTDDVLSFLDHALATVPGLDADRVGIMGGSYGGYLSAWIIAHEHRFAGAIVERGFLDPASFLGASDIGWYFMPGYNGHTLAEQDRQSPMLLADQVTTPTFVVHSELDLRCPLSQGLRYFTALKQAGVDTEMLVFPGENHELSRSGTPWHRRQRFDAILDWWDRHLPVHGPVEG
ncbi:S9 family peptidase [Propioniciclava flava]|uniref:S9 family peptidase n=1 Tax=Propioniciclava flava TaxID=2072026 RepID=A0A4Q2EHK2_9ACTN|nr:S9 family peptidase [Propioniciclava flava]RXW33067.1 S9 family peptidase [Propioniciclava flava]